MVRLTELQRTPLQHVHNRRGLLQCDLMRLFDVSGNAQRHELREILLPLIHAGEDGADRRSIFLRQIITLNFLRGHADLRCGSFESSARLVELVGIVLKGEQCDTAHSAAHVGKGNRDLARLV